MNIMSARAEIGILATANVVSKASSKNKEEALYFPPVSSDYIGIRVRQFAEILVSLKRTRLLLLIQEIALLEQLAEMDWSGLVTTILPIDMDEESRERIRANVPNGIRVEFIDEGMFPAFFRPDNGVLLCTGIAPDGYRVYLPPSCCRMMSLYKGFQGDPCDTYIPEAGWTYADDEYFTRVI